MELEDVQVTQKNQVVIDSPGRINLIGEHTDYNQGFVLPAAIDKKIRLSFSKNNSSYHCTLSAENKQEQFAFDLKKIRPLSSGWQNYALGVVAELQQLSPKIEGFHCSFGGNVPIGAGMSSSAALGCGLAMGLNVLFELNLRTEQLIRAAQRAEHNFVGTLCGIMDQFASMMGKENAAILLDCKTLDYRYVPLDLGNYALLFLNSNISHSLADSAYNTRRKECEGGVEILQDQYPDIESLRDVNLSMLERHQDLLPPVTFKRCAYVVKENQRVLDAAQALTDKDFPKLGQLLYASHEGLQHDYEVSCPEIDYLVAQTLDKPHILGARMMGGGFGGCTINLIEQNQVESFIEDVSAAYHKQFGIELSPYTVGISDGTKIV